MKKTILLLLSAIAFTGCSDNHESEPSGLTLDVRFSEVLITNYLFIDSLQSYYDPADPFRDNDPRDYIRIQFWPSKMINHIGGLWIREDSSYFLRGQGTSALTKQEFDQISTYYGNEGYNRMIPSAGVGALPYDFLSIDITSDNDFDDSHPAGSSLADIVKFHSVTYYKYIQSGYKDSNVCYLDKLISELNGDDLKLITSDLGRSLIFTTAPPAGEHTFTVTFRTADKVFWSTCTAVIE